MDTGYYWIITEHLYWEKEREVQRERERDAGLKGVTIIIDCTDRGLEQWIKMPAENDAQNGLHCLSVMYSYALPYPPHVHE